MMEATKIDATPMLVTGAIDESVAQPDANLKPDSPPNDDFP
jgi:hypothetical protein